MEKPLIYSVDKFIMNIERKNHLINGGDDLELCEMRIAKRRGGHHIHIQEKLKRFVSCTKYF